MEMSIEKIAELLSDKEKDDYPFSIEERQFAAQASADTWRQS